MTSGGVVPSVGNSLPGNSSLPVWQAQRWPQNLGLCSSRKLLALEKTEGNRLHSNPHSSVSVPF